MFSSGPTVPMIIASIKAVVPLMEANNDQLHIIRAVKSCASLIPLQVHVNHLRHITPKSWIVPVHPVFKS